VALYERGAPGDTDTIDNFDADPAMRVSVLALNGVFDTGLTTVLDALTTANKLARATGLTTPGFEITLVEGAPNVLAFHFLLHRFGRCYAYLVKRFDSLSSFRMNLIAVARKE